MFLSPHCSFYLLPGFGISSIIRGLINQIVEGNFDFQLCSNLRQVLFVITIADGYLVTYKIGHPYSTCSIIYELHRTLCDQKLSLKKDIQLLLVGLCGGYLTLILFMFTIIKIWNLRWNYNLIYTFLFIKILYFTCILNCY